VNESRLNWVWYLVVNDHGNIMESFNSVFGADDYQERYGGIVIRVKEVAESSVQ